MASKSLWAIVDFLQANQTVTPRQVQNLLGCDCKKAHNLLLHLVRRAVVIRTGDPHHPVYMLQPGGDLNIKQLKSSMRKNVVASVCRTSPAMQRVLAFYGRTSV
ncbi:hypothetical protein ACHHZC_14260 [Citrobacter freundii complex sp. 2024EL-00228]|jgi:hypothetical protein|uniref:Uncharacterized protein n=1 Tax=Citrobacter freundii TaxID=546 RepID=A0A9P3Z0Y7_CITFR|nr:MULTISPECIES: hypothetical protein [Enterobacteriaceae]EHV57885.1 hypothetical protein ECDEC6B_2561 [Escherichia coli DEC6B]EHV60001.1 hypothetical protein ECDEC6A_2227 [Escherichia coli DEC6A]EJC8216488.1 hypothetical protein [Citrobacter freundii]ELK7553259.1 hypothetical protein [Citrobacter freundii]MBJ9314594.1 hypothetical protein [Citrobacter freundii]